MKYRFAFAAALAAALLAAPSALANSVSGVFVSIGDTTYLNADPTPHPDPTTPTVANQAFGYTICADPSTFPQNCGPGSPQEGAGQPPDGYVVTCDRGFHYSSYSAFRGDVVGLGTMTVTCQAFDPNGALAGTATTDFILTDATGPTLFGNPGTINATTNGNHPVAVSYTTPTAQDNVDGTLPVSCDHASGSLFPIGTTTVACYSTDASANQGATTFDVVVTKK